MDPTHSPTGPRLACRDLPSGRFLLSDVHLFDPWQGLDIKGDLLVADGVIRALGTSLDVPEGAEVLGDLAGCWVFPGLVDPHVHLRTPGYEYKEDLASGSLAAAAGGYTAVVAMANTDPVVDVGPLAAWVLEQAARDGLVRIGQVGAVSRGLKGEELAEMRGLAEAGAVAFADDGQPVEDADLLLHALRYARGTGRPLLLHLEDRSLALDGVMHEGRWSARLGLRGIASTCEAGPLARDLEVIKYAVAEEARIAAGRQDAGVEEQGRAVDVPLVHFQHLSCAESVRLLGGAKEQGLPVTGEVTPHHLLLTDEQVNRFDSNLKVNPPLRSEDDRQALIAALADGSIDCVAGDHAPHAPHEKEVPFEEALCGTTSLETSLAALHTGLVLPKHITLARLVEAMSGAPSKILGLTAPALRAGAPADFCVFDPEETWQVTPATLRGKSRNCAFLGETLTGRVRMTVVDGAPRFLRARGEA